MSEPSGTDARLDRIEQLENSLAWYQKMDAMCSDHVVELTDKLEAAETKLAKAVEILILCRDMFDEVAHPSDPLSVLIKTTLAELEVKK